MRRKLSPRPAPSERRLSAQSANASARRWTPPEDALMRSGAVPEGRTPAAARARLRLLSAAG
jgi:hypothetical protein